MCDQKEPVDVVYKFVPCDRFYGQMDEYLAGNLYFADWHSFDDKREGKYMCSSTVLEKLRENIKEEKGSYRVCSTTLANDIFELWDRYMKDSPAICLVVKIEGLDTAKRKQCLKEFSGHRVSYKYKLPNYSELKGKDDDEKAVEILTRKKIRYAYEQEYRLIIKNNTLKAGVGIMYPVGKITGVIVGGCCPQADSGFNKLRHAVLGKGLYFERAYIDFPRESVSKQVDYCCFGNQNIRNAL